MLFYSAAKDIQKALQEPLSEMYGLLKKLSIRFHDRHYLLILLKKHLIGTLSDSLIELSKEDLKERLKLIEEVLFLQCSKSNLSFLWLSKPTLLKLPTGKIWISNKNRALKWIV